MDKETEVWAYRYVNGNVYRSIFDENYIARLLSNNPGIDNFLIYFLVEK